MRHSYAKEKEEIMKSKITFILALAAMVVLAIVMVQAQNDWPMFNRDLLNTGVANPALTGITVPIEMWSYTTDNQIGSGSPVIGDIDDDGTPEVLVPTANFAVTGGIYALNSDGSLKWKYETGDYGTYATPPLADIDKDGMLETIFPSYKGKIVAVDDDGTEIWSVDKGPGGTRSVIADMTEDAGLEVVAGAAGKTFLLTASDGIQIWEAPYQMLCDPAIADIDGDDKLEVVFSATGKFIVALNAEDGSLWWTSAAMGQDAQNNLSIISDINGDGYSDVVAGSRDKKLYVFSGLNGSLLWNYTVIVRCFSAAVADFNGDGFDDVVTTAGTKTTMVSYNPRVYETESYVYVLDVKNQVLLWQHDIVGKKYYTTERSPSIADVNGDGTPDVLVAGLSQNLYALSGVDGSEIWTIATNDPSANIPAVGDLDGDGGMEIVVSAGSSVQVFTQEPPPVVEMDSFVIAKAKIEPAKGKASVKGKLALDLVNGDNVNISDDIIVTVGTYSEIIPGGTMVEKYGKWEYKQPKGAAGTLKKMKIDWNNGKFDINIDKADFSALTDPDNVTISVQVGDDLGLETITMKVKKDKWEYRVHPKPPAPPKK
jgi:outer membrane protein assembly factor BamB